MKFFDTHCHLNLKPLKSKLNEIILEISRQKCYVNIVGIDYESSLLAVAMAKKSSYLFATIGIHPTEIKNIVDEKKVLATFELLLKNKFENKIIAIGETGFDFFRSKNYDLEFLMQSKWFELQKELAIKHDLPLMLHVRDGHKEMLCALENVNHYGIVHCFNQDYDLAQKYFSLQGEWKISIPGIITYKKANGLVEAVAQIPLEKILIETDAPWLAPVPYRGKTNFPYYSMENLKKIALIKKINLNDCSKQIFKNSLKIFKLNLNEND